MKNDPNKNGMTYASHTLPSLVGVKGACGGLDAWGGDESGSDRLRLVVWLKHCFGVLVIFDCCFVMMEQCDCRPVGRGGSRGFVRTPLLGRPKKIILCLASQTLPFLCK